MAASEQGVISALASGASAVQLYLRRSNFIPSPVPFDRHDVNEATMSLFLDWYKEHLARMMLSGDRPDGELVL